MAYSGLTSSKNNRPIQLRVYYMIGRWEGNRVVEWTHYIEIDGVSYRVGNTNVDHEFLD